MKTARNNEEFCAAILTDLSKASDCICKDRLIDKLIPYGFDRDALMLINDYLSDRSQKKLLVGFSFSVYLDIVYVYRRDLYLGLCC